MAPPTSLDPMDEQRLVDVALAIEAADSILTITGAGISADSGIPTYRGVGGLYNDRRTEENLSIEQALSSVTLQLRPDITWKYLWEIGQTCRSAQPNRAHQVMWAIEQWKPQAWTLTQNIDGLHRAAGSRRVIEIHGRNDRLVCMGCGAEPDMSEVFPQWQPPAAWPPRCAQCQGVLRPRVVLFGEPLPPEAVQHLHLVLAAQPAVVMIVGTTAAFPYIAQPVAEAVEDGRWTIEVNPTPTALSGLVRSRFAIGAAAWFDALWQLLKARNPDLADILD